jgi:predicted nucleic acid-binding protein
LSEVVLDASVALAWALPDEGTPTAETLFKQKMDKTVFWVPPLWWYEVTNALLVAVRRGRLKDHDRLEILEIYGILPIQTDVTLNEGIMSHVYTIAKEYALSVYDASYLELARRKRVKLATLDEKLSSAARQADIGLVF